MSLRGLGLTLGALGVAGFLLVRPEAPSVGSDCEVLSSGVLREPVAAVSSVAIVLAGWVVARHRSIPGVALLLAGAASLAAHATAHPTARALDGIVAAGAVVAVLWSIVRDRPELRRIWLGLGLGSIAVATWLLTRTDAPLCDAVGPWGHAGWHGLVGVAAVVALADEPLRRAVAD